MGIKLFPMLSLIFFLAACGYSKPQQLPAKQPLIPQSTIPIVPTQVPNSPSIPEDIIDPHLMAAWWLLEEYDSSMARFILGNHIAIFVYSPKDTVELSSFFAYNCLSNINIPKEAGSLGAIGISEKLSNDPDWMIVTAAIIHEATHARLHLNGAPCGCAIDREYEAHHAQIVFLMMQGRRDLAEKYFGPGIFNNGNLNAVALRQEIRQTYAGSNCADTITSTPSTSRWPTPEPTKDPCPLSMGYMIDKMTGLRVPYVEGQGELKIAGCYQAPNGKWYRIGAPSTTSTPQPGKHWCQFGSDELCLTSWANNPGPSNK
jgi:hypothetical protein